MQTFLGNWSGARGATAALIGAALLSGCEYQTWGWGYQEPPAATDANAEPLNENPNAEKNLVPGKFKEGSAQQKPGKPPRPEPPKKWPGPRPSHEPGPRPSPSHSPITDPGEDSAPALSVRWVEYESLPEAELAPLMEEVNEIWSQCGIAFRIDERARIEARELALPDPVAEYSDLRDLRQTFAADRSLLVVATGRWDRRGGIGSTWANAWTAMPGDSSPGAVLDAVAARDPRIIAHELGHLLTLGHFESASHLMNPLVYPHSRELSADECEAARWAMRDVWGRALR